MKFNIILFEGTDIIKFGMTRKEVQLLLGIKPELFKKADYIPEVEDYKDICHVYYDTDDKCEAIEFFSPSEVYYESISLLGKPKSKIRKVFSKFDDFVEDVSSIGLKNNEFSVYIPNSVVESVYIARKGYNEKIEKLHKEYKKNNPDIYTLLPISETNNLILLSELTGRNGVIIRDVINNVSDLNAFEERYQKIIENNKKVDSYINFLLDFYKSGDEKQNIQQLIAIQNEYMQMVEKAYDMFRKGDIDKAKKYLPKENKLIQRKFAKIFDFFSSGMEFQQCSFSVTFKF